MGPGNVLRAPSSALLGSVFFSPVRSPLIPYPTGFRSPVIRDPFVPRLLDIGRVHLSNARGTIAKTTSTWAKKKNREKMFIPVGFFRQHISSAVETRWSPGNTSSLLITPLNRFRPDRTTVFKFENLQRHTVVEIYFFCPKVVRERSENYGRNTGSHLVTACS